MHVAKDRKISKDRSAETDATTPQEERLDRLFAPLDSMQGIGPRTAAMLTHLLGGKAKRPARRLDLLLHLPHGMIDHHLGAGASALIEGERATVELTIVSHHPPFQLTHPYRVTCTLDGETLQLVFFRGRRAYLKNLLPTGTRRVVSGILGRYGETWQIVHPDLITRPEAVGQARWLQPVYPSTQGLHQKTLARAIQRALEDLPALPEWQDPTWLQARGWPGVTEALTRLHRPEDGGDIEPCSSARTRLAYDELLATQLSLSLTRRRGVHHGGRSLLAGHALRRVMIEALPFDLTQAQEQAVVEIDADMAKDKRMLRLLQGDVGSGKTVVAAIAMLRAIEAGTQAALMAPTEVLARQHAANVARLLAPTGISIALLTGRERGAERRRILKALASGDLQAVIGTHALFQDDVTFADLGLAVIDEQHRFGVDQRIELAGKGPNSDVLVMTATPIPRTLVLSFYGDIAVSELRQKPTGRQPIATRAVPQSKLERVVEAVGRALGAGEQIFWICPLVTASEELELVAAEDRYTGLFRCFGNQVGLIHGQMSARDKDVAMRAFVCGDMRLLVATTVIEVGVDVPAATIMVIEHAERFGLAQLHQLRGRVGRGERRSTCLLLYAEPLGSLARSRLDIVRRIEDGFLIAEQDLRLRGPGEILGTRQSGVPALRFADLAVHADLLAAARDDAKLVLDRDPELRSRRGRALRLLLRWFEQDAAAAYLRSG